MKVVLVLGGGGAAGWLFHAGMLRALQADTGWDPNDARLLIGTSAGAAVAAGLRYGATPDEFVEFIRRGPSAAERAEFRRQVEGRERSFRPLAPGLVRQVLPGGSGIGVAVSGLLPRGIYPTGGLRRFPGVDGHETWPDGLWIPAVRVEDGAVVVFGRDRGDVDVLDAVEASSAVPAMFEPKVIDGETFIDGGMASPTAAALAIAARPDLVIVSSPMTRPSWRPLYVLARRRLAQERRALATAGIPFVVIEPEEGKETFGGFPRHDPAKAPLILEAAVAAARRAVPELGALATP